MNRLPLTRRLWIVSAAGVLTSAAWASKAGAQSPLKHQVNPLVQSQLRFLEMRVVMGRIEITTDDPIRNFSTQSKQGENSERLSIEFAPQTLSLDYVLGTPQGDYSIRVVDSREVIVRRNPGPGQKALPVLLVQPQEGPLQLIVGTGETAREVRAHSLWQIALAEPEIFREEIAPMLHWLRPNWRLGITADEIETSLTSWNAPVAVVSEAVIDQFVSDLGANEFSVREEAERRLQAVGAQAVPWLRRLDLARLDAEQRARVRRVVGELGEAEEEDSSRGVVRWLAVDPQTWLLLLNRDDAKLRQLALDKLTRQLNRPIEFDPAADAETRQKQLAELRKSLEARK
ncbi:MAG: hypothetical protein JNM18_01480 [Planctomycetaceae bacterium]|nr:hypothetical protein [Planctomycetaceae bacterium]